jgi:glycosyltransferase involved in cell wall biosynthesis
VALLGSRGVPAGYGGFETLFEELGSGLVGRGYDVTVYCRSRYTPRALDSYRGMRLVTLPTLPTKYLDTPIHTLLAALHCVTEAFDAVLLVNAANALFVPLLRSAGLPVALNVDGIERRRAKWGMPGRLVYALSEWLAARLPDALVTDAETIRAHYLRRFGADSTVIPYGVTPRPLPPGPVLAGLGLTSRSFLLYVSRFEPENNPHRVVQAYRDVPGDLPLVMVGTAPYARRFITEVRRAADDRVVFPGAIYGDGYRELLSHALLYIQATEVGGTHPALVEAMGYGNCVVVNDTPENREVAGPAATYFRAREPQTLTRALVRLLADAELRRDQAASARSRALGSYRWERVVESYVELLRRLMSRS